MTRQTFKVSSQREVYLYSVLYCAAGWEMEQAENNAEGRSYNCMASIILSAFCMEAYINHICRKLLPYWDNQLKKNVSIENKLKIICHHLGFGTDFGKRPFQSFKTIFKFRNLIAHGETLRYTRSHLQESPVQSPVLSEDEKAWWEKQCELQNAKILFTDTKSMLCEINKVATGTEGDAFLGFQGLSIGSVTLIE